MPRKSIIPVFVPHLGCPHDCVFCNQRHISGQTARQTAQSVTDIIKDGLKKAGDGREVEIAFYGGSFTAIPEREQEDLLGAAQPFLRGGSVSSIRLSTRPDCIDGETLDRLFHFGVCTIELGSQSMCDDVLELSGRGHTAEDTRLAAAAIKSRGFSLILQMMTGLPGDTREKTMYTAKEIVSLRPDGVRIYPTVIVRDTALYEMWKNGEYPEHTVEAAVEWCADILPVFEKAGIPVIRLGLNPTEELSEGLAAGGAYHPALGELVRSRVFLRKAEKLLEKCGGRASVLGVEKSRVSIMTGQKRCNIIALENKFGINGLKVVSAEVGKDEVKIIE